MGEKLSRVVVLCITGIGLAMLAGCAGIEWVNLSGRVAGSIVRFVDEPEQDYETQTTATEKKGWYETYLKNETPRPKGRGITK